MQWAFPLFLVAANFALSCNGGFIPFKRLFPSESPDVGRNVVSSLLFFTLYSSKIWVVFLTNKFSRMWPILHILSRPTDLCQLPTAGNTLGPIFILYVV